MLSRRDLLKFLLATPAAAFVDYEQLLWVPKPIVTVPAMTLAELNAITLRYIMPGIMDSFFKPDPLLAFFKSKDAWTHQGTEIPTNLHWRVQ